MKYLRHLLFRLIDKLSGFCVHGHPYGTGCIFCEYDGFDWMKLKDEL